jgi:hypothetical protein
LEEGGEGRWEAGGGREEGKRGLAHWRYYAQPARESSGPLAAAKRIVVKRCVGETPTAIGA